MTLEFSTRYRCGVCIRPVRALESCWHVLRRLSTAVLSQTVAGLALGAGIALMGLSPPAYAEMPLIATGAGGLGDRPTSDIINPSAVGDVLSQADVARYEKIFALQKKAQWKTADTLIKALDDPALLGHVLYQRYMHPTGWHSRAAELKAWMASYHDLPQAARMYTFARHRGARGVHRPTWNGLTGSGGGSDGSGGGSDDVSVRGVVGTYASSSARALAKRVWSQVKNALQQGHTLTAKQRLWAAKEHNSLAAVDYDRLSGTLAHAYFIDGEDQRALTWAQSAIARSGQRAPMALWAGGLAAWRMGNLPQAAAWFKTLSMSQKASPWLNAAGGYWAARAALRNHWPGQAVLFLKRAAAQPRTFYGLLAGRALGLSSRIQWEDRALTAEEVATLDKSAAGHRALALVQVGRLELAEKELRGLYRQATDAQRDAIVHLADISGLSGLALYLSALRSSAALRDSAADAIAGAIDTARYPIPVWTPKDGWRLDRALIFALIRQESAFDPSAQSWAGARGLMQVMPNTAAYISGKSQYRHGSGREALLSPELNLALGQSYLEYLLGLNDVAGNLFYALAAYNAGPGNLLKWKDQLASHVSSSGGADDPLLFIESIPILETRVYVQRVMANLWMYRDRMGQKSPSLDMVASGDWPKYSPLDQLDVAAASSTR